MELTDQQIAEFIAISREEFGIELDRQTARKIGNDIMGYFDLLAKIYHREKEQVK